MTGGGATPEPAQPRPAAEDEAARAPFAHLPWRATRRPGLSLLPLDPPDLLERRGPTAAICLIRMDPGTGYGAHRHLGEEHVQVLAGGYRDERGEHRAGASVRYDAGTVHEPIALGRSDRPIAPDNPACILLSVIRVGIEPLPAAAPARSPRSEP